jgi:hypothetical protein
MTALPSRETKPSVNHRHGTGRWAPLIEVADFSNEERPAFRVHGHCRNCHWKGEARFKVGYKVPLWLECPKCETWELSAHGDYAGRDDKSRAGGSRGLSAVL